MTTVQDMIAQSEPVSIDVPSTSKVEERLSHKRNSSKAAE